MIIKEINPSNPSISDEQLTEIRQQMLKFARLQLRDNVLAEDMVQGALLSAIKNLANFKRQAALKTWLFAILKNKIIDYLRQKDRFVTESELTTDEDSNSFFDQEGHWRNEYYPQRWQERSIQMNSGHYLKFVLRIYLPDKGGYL